MAPTKLLHVLIHPPRPQLFTTLLLPAYFAVAAYVQFPSRTASDSPTFSLPQHPLPMALSTVSVHTVTVTLQIFATVTASPAPTIYTPTYASFSLHPDLDFYNEKTRFYRLTFAAISAAGFTALCVYYFWHLFGKYKVLWRRWSKYEREAKEVVMRVGESAGWSEAGSIERLPYTPEMIKKRRGNLWALYRQDVEEGSGRRVFGMDWGSWRSGMSSSTARNSFDQV